LEGVEETPVLKEGSSNPIKAGPRPADTVRCGNEYGEHHGGTARTRAAPPEADPHPDSRERVSPDRKIVARGGETE
jgi:hypothetical protein